MAAVQQRHSGLGLELSCGRHEKQRFRIHTETELGNELEFQKSGEGLKNDS